MEVANENTSTVTGQKRRRSDDDNESISHETNGDSDRSKRVRSSAEVESIGEEVEYPEPVSAASSNEGSNDGDDGDAKDDDDTNSQDPSGASVSQGQPGTAEAKERERVNQLLKYDVKAAVSSKRVLEVIIGPPSLGKKPKGKPKQKPPKVQRTMVKTALFNYLGRLNLVDLVGMTPSGKLNNTPAQRKTTKELKLRATLSATCYLAFESKAAADSALTRLQTTPLEEQEADLRMAVLRVVDDIARTPSPDHNSARRDRRWYLQGRMQASATDAAAQSIKQPNKTVGSEESAPQNEKSTARNLSDAQDPVQPPSHTSIILSDLSETHRMLQLRYWSKKGLHTLARCPICAVDGHMEATCPRRTCEFCGQQDRHRSSACPRNIKCTKCRSRGHIASSCTSKLKMTQADGLICDMCSQPHKEEDCPWIWRTFRPQTIPNVRKVDRLAIFCYECGYDGHYGYDCPSLSKVVKRDKGTNNTFSMAFAENFITIPQQQQRVRSGQKNKHYIADSAGNFGTSDGDGDSSDPASFYGRKVERTQKPHASMSLRHIKGFNPRTKQRPPLEASYLPDPGPHPQASTALGQASSVNAVPTQPPLPNEPPPPYLPPLPAEPPPNN